MANLRRYWPVLLMFTCAARKKDKGPPPPPPVGWHQDAGWTGSCYSPPDFGQLGIIDRRMARDQALQAMMEQWRGARNDGVAFDAVPITNVENVLLGTPEKIEVAAVENHEQCKKAMSGGGTSAWSGWLSDLPARMLQGVCTRPLDDTMFWYADLGVGWQFSATMCEDDVIEITASEGDEYRVDDKGPWINAQGDVTKRASGADYPCTLEGCYAGQLVMRFRGQSGAVIIKPVGLRLVFDPPEHGTIDVSINDWTFYNNEFRVVGGIQHRTAITYTPLD